MLVGLAWFASKGCLICVWLRHTLYAGDGSSTLAHPVCGGLVLHGCALCAVVYAHVVLLQSNVLSQRALSAIDMNIADSHAAIMGYMAIVVGFRRCNNGCISGSHLLYGVALSKSGETSI
jgi:hypothetical protein